MKILGIFHDFRIFFIEEDSFYWTLIKARKIPVYLHACFTLKTKTEKCHQIDKIIRNTVTLYTPSPYKVTFQQILQDASAIIANSHISIYTMIHGILRPIP